MHDKPVTEPWQPVLEPDVPNRPRWRGHLAFGTARHQRIEVIDDREHLRASLG